MSSTEFFTAVTEALGSDAVDTTDATRDRYGANGLPQGPRRPAGVLYPASTEDVQLIVHAARKHGMTLWPISTGQNVGEGNASPVREGQVVLHLGKRMNKILEINDELGYVVLEPGVTFRALRAELARRGDTLMLSGTSGPPDGGPLGNAMDRGAGYTPYFEHFGMSCGMKVVLGDGSVLRTSDGEIKGTKSSHINKYGFGPALDGIFTQSNFGIVTELGMWLMPRPPVTRSFVFTFPDDDDLAEIFDIIRPLKMNNVVPTTVKVTHSLYAISTQMTYPHDRAGGATPLPTAVRKELEQEYGTGAWTVSGAFYGPTVEALQPMIERVRGLFEASGKATYVSHEQALANPMFKIHLDTFTGEPTEEEIPLHDWCGSGCIWMILTTPMIGSVANEHQEMSRRVLAEHGLDYQTEFVCGPRICKALHGISFDPDDPADRKRAEDAFRALIANYDDAGFPPGRMPTSFQEEAMERLPELKRITGAIKKALDPDGVIAPGKYGIT